MTVMSRKTVQENAWMPEIYRKRLLGYAESFQELAKSLGGHSAREKADGDEAEDGISPADTDRTGILEQRRILENRMLISDNLNEVAQIMEELAEEVYHFRPMEDRCRRMLIHALRAESIYAENFCYLKGFIQNEEGEDPHAISVTLYTDKKDRVRAEEVADMLSVLLRMPLQLSATSPLWVEQDAHSFVFMEEAKYVAITGFCKITKENESFSGDHYSVLESEKGKLTLLLSDGTGSGERASEDSERVLDLMEKLLETGYGLEPAISMVNAAVLARGQEYCHPTLDACELDLYSGSCNFCKVGGAASFLKRGDKVEQISQGSLPLGIFRNVELSTIKRQLSDGDYLILMTDGVLDAMGEGNYEDAMREAIAGLEEVNPGEIAEKLLQMALCCCKGHIRDDMTILVAGIWRNTARRNIARRNVAQ